MPHSYAIAIYRLHDYVAANIPVLPVKKGIPYTKMSMLIYVILFTLAAISPTLFGFTGMYCLIVVGLISLYWLYLTVKGFAAIDNTLWARKVFLFSIIVITLLCIMMVLD
jgi:protoheme IX farnesyltransferase